MEKLNYGQISKFWMMRPENNVFKSTAEIREKIIALVNHKVSVHDRQDLVRKYSLIFILLLVVASKIKEYNGYP